MLRAVVLPARAVLTVVVLDGAVEEHGEEAAVDNRRGSLEDKRNETVPEPARLPPRFRTPEARIVFPDVPPVIEVDTLIGHADWPDPRRGIAGTLLGQGSLRRGELLDGPGHAFVLLLERERPFRQAAQDRCKRQGLGSGWFRYQRQRRGCNPSWLNLTKSRDCRRESLATAEAITEEE